MNERQPQHPFLASEPTQSPRDVERERDAIRATLINREQALMRIGHDLRGPMASVRAISELLMERTNQSEEDLHFIQMMHDEVLRMAEMLNGILAEGDAVPPTKADKS